MSDRRGRKQQIMREYPQQGFATTRRGLIWLGAGLAAVAGLFGQAPAALAAGTVNVLYAGSLVNLMEHGIGPAFDKATGNQFQGFAGGSDLLANQIKGKLRQGDVFVSANPKVNESLMGDGKRQLGELVHCLCSIAAGHRVQRVEQVRERPEDEAVVPGSARTRNPHRPHRPEA